MIKITFPKVAVKPSAPGGIQELHYFDLRKAVAHALSNYNWADIWRMTLSAQEQMILNTIPTEDFKVLEDALSAEWQEAFMDPTFGDKFTYYVYYYWWDNSVTPFLSPQAEYMHYFVKPATEEMKARYRQLKRYIQRPTPNMELQNKYDKWAQYCDLLLIEQNMEEDDANYLEKVLNFWNEMTANQSHAPNSAAHKPCEPLMLPDGRYLQPHLVRKRYRDYAKNKPEVIEAFKEEHPVTDLDTYEGRCEFVLELELEKLKLKGSI